MKRSLSLKTILSKSSDSSLDRQELVQVNCKKCLAPVPADAAHLHTCPNWQVRPDPPSPTSREDIETKTGTKTQGFVIQVNEEPLEPQVSYLESGKPVSTQTREAVLEQAAVVVADKMIKDTEEHRQPRYHQIPPSAPPTLPPPPPPIPPLQPRRVQAVQLQQAGAQAVGDSDVGHHGQNVEKQISEEADKIATALTDKISSQLAQQQQQFQERMLLLLSQPSSRSTSRSSSSVSSRRSSRTASRQVSEN